MYNSHYAYAHVFMIPNNRHNVLVDDPQHLQLPMRRAEDPRLDAI